MPLTDDELDAVYELLHTGIETSGQFKPTLTALAEKMRGDLSDVSESELEFLEMLAELRRRILNRRQREASVDTQNRPLIDTSKPAIS